MSEQAVYLDDVYAPLEDGLEAPYLTLLENDGEDGSYDPDASEPVGRVALMKLVAVDGELLEGWDADEEAEPPLLAQLAGYENGYYAEDEVALDTGFTSVGSRRKQPRLTANQEADLAARIEAGVLARERLGLAQAGELSLSRQDMRDLRQLAGDGDRAKARMFMANQGLVGKWARARLGGGVDFEDMFQDGNLGLLRAIEKYDYQGHKFSTYATPWIRGAIGRGINARTMPGLSTREAERLNSILITQKRLAQELAEAPTPERIAEEVTSGPEEVAGLLEWWRVTRELSTDTPVKKVDDKRDITLGERIMENTDGVDDTAIRKEIQASIHAALDELPPQAADIVRRRHGLSADDGLTCGEAQGFKDIAVHWGITKQEAQNLYARTMRQMRKDPRLAALL